MEKKLGLETVSELAKILDENDLTEIEYDTDEVRIRVARDGQTFVTQAPIATQSAVSAPVDNAPSSDTTDYEKHAGAVKSPMVGVVYVAPEPAAPPYVKEGDTVTAGQTLLLVEAMKTFNPVTAPKSGTITKILVEDGMPVEYGEPLMIVE